MALAALEFNSPVRRWIILARTKQITIPDEHTPINNETMFFALQLSPSGVFEIKAKINIDAAFVSCPGRMMIDHG